MGQIEKGCCGIKADLSEVEGFLDTHGDRLYRAALLLCGNEDEAEDLIQETLLQTIKSWKTFRGGSAIYTWVYGILLNLHRTTRRKQKRLIYDEKRVQAEVRESKPAGGLDRDLCAIKLMEALQQLSPEHREVVILRFFDGLKLDEIAQQTGAATGTVKSRLHYAIQSLEKLLPQELNLLATDDTYSTDNL